MILKKSDFGEKSDFSRDDFKEIQSDFGEKSDFPHDDFKEIQSDFGEKSDWELWPQTQNRVKNKPVRNKLSSSK